MRWGMAVMVIACMVLASASALAVGPTGIRGGPPMTAPTAQGSLPPASGNHAAVVKQYKHDTQETLSILQQTVQTPKLTMTSMRAQRLVDQYVDKALRHLHTLLRDPKVQSELARLRRQEEVAAYVKRQRAYWEYMRRLARDALNLQVEMLKKREALQKAIEDSPKLIAGFVEELKAADEKINEYLKGVGARIDQRERERTEKFVKTVVGNVQSAWGNLLEAHKEFMEKKENKPEEAKKKADKIKAYSCHKCPGPARHGLPQHFSQTETAIKESVTKGQKKYKETYHQATASQRPLTTGSAAHDVPSFKGAKPDQLVTKARERMKRAPRMVPPSITKD